MESPAPSPPGTSLRPGGLKWGLRARTGALLLSATGITVVAAVAIGSRLVGDIRRDLCSALARDQSRLTQQRILAKVSQELALSQRLAGSPLLEEWVEHEKDSVRRMRFFREAEGYRRAFAGKSYFVAPVPSRNYFYADRKTGGKPILGYVINPKKPQDAWFFTALRQAAGYALNVDLDRKFGVTNVWINVVARGLRGRPIAVIGTGLELTAFLKQVLESREPGVTTMIVDRNGVIVAHPDIRRMEFNVSGNSSTEKTLARLASSPAGGARLTALLDQALKSPEDAPTAEAVLDGAERVVAMSAIPGLGWTVVAAVDLKSGYVLSPTRVLEISAISAVLLVFLLIVASVGIHGMVLRPLVQLTEVVRQIEVGDYRVRLNSTRSDELGELSRAFDGMAQQVRAHTENLERLVEARTSELALAHQDVQAAHRKLTDSIRYASLIQTAILPTHALREAFQGEYFVVWQPRDVVGGDLYVYRSQQNGCILGVIDCAGHGVPGACMTMTAHAALEVAVGSENWNDPAGLLQLTDQTARGMIPGDLGGQVATNMDMGLCSVDLSRREVSFAGARISLFWSDGEGCEMVPGSRRGVNDRRPGAYSNTIVALYPGRTFYLATDGLLDQSGGEFGYGFGQRRFMDWIAKHSSLPLAEQQVRLQETLERYQGDHPQRDDITILAFRFDEHV